ncbi:MAG: deoxyuridine 5'-triphosphate nucleotidohydrolase [Thermoprotei archaeon]|nr:MAG: deoxyuridine 5'-triphosphate nucleotidohydrolase [Thermoprotei archaeon]RLE99875.1 MAG: deoxyuridine 5'-triphosphate nucleotidohydrolase [Thermoprotei archaeon]HDI74712.1 deoxyuridine 5'-triphosphate nucleotidohydrolase [Thermoprotei archaeon]
MSVIPGHILAEFIKVLSNKQIQPAGVDLTVREIYCFQSTGAIKKKETLLPSYLKVKDISGVFKLLKGAYLVRFNEIVEVPEDCIGIFLPRSSLLRIGATMCSALWDPGYKGRGVGLLLVHNEHGIEIEVNSRIAQMIFIRMEKKPNRTYSGKYQHEGLE